MIRTNVIDSWKQLKNKMKTRWGKPAINLIVSAAKVEKASQQEMRPMQEENMSRRAVLRGALLAVTFGLLAPLSLFSSPTASADDAAQKPKTAKKVSKKSVKYQYKPNGKEHCGNCVNFIAESKTCKRVAGPIDPNGWCILWGKPA